MLYQDIVKRHEQGTSGALPPVLPVVFYNGASAWNACSDLRELVARGPSELDAFQASQRYLLIDQRTLDPSGLAQTRNVVAELFRLELSDSPEVLIDVTTSLAVWLCGEEQATLRRSIANWITHLQKREFGGISFDEVEGLLEGKTMGERFVRKYATWTDAVEDRGLQRGLAQGRAEALNVLRTALKRQLAKRFGDLPPAAAARIDGAAAEDVELWFERVLDAASIDAVLSD